MLPLSDNENSGKFPIITVALIAINVIVFLIEMSVPDLDLFFAKYALIPAFFSLTDTSTWYRVITAAFLHGGISHIFFNMLFLWVFGNNVEDRLGPVKYLLFYLTAAIGAALLQYVVDPTSTLPMLGASGAIAGVLGFYLVVFPTHTIRTLLFFGYGAFIRNIPAQIFLGYWAITQFFNGVGTLAINQADQGGTAWFAHIGGLLVGALVGVIIRSMNRPPEVTYTSTYTPNY